VALLSCIPCKSKENKTNVIEPLDLYRKGHALPVHSLCLEGSKKYELERYQKTFKLTKISKN
jgi:hypothetical protein